MIRGQQCRHDEGAIGHDADISMLISDSIRDMPLLPHIITRLITADPDSDHYFDDLRELASIDPCFAIKIIGIANSVYFRPDHDISRISHALSRIGAAAVADLLSHLTCMRVFVPTTADQRYLWVHSIETALTNRFIARLIPDIRHLSEDAYYAGLLHDIGRFFMLERFPVKVSQVDSTHWSSPDQLVRSERTFFGYSHSELGWKISQKVQLPEMLAQVIRHHHTYRISSRHRGNDPCTRGLIQATQFSDRFSITILRDREFASWGHADLCEHIEKRCLNMIETDLGISASTLAEHAREIHAEAGARVAQLRIFPDSH